MKILHVITSLKTGGAEKLMVDIIPQLRDLGNDVDLLVFDGTYTPFYSELESNGVKVYNLGMYKSVYDIRYLYKLSRFLQKHKYDIIHTHNTASQLFVALLAGFMNVILCTTEHSTSNRRREMKWYAIIDRWMYSKYKYIICISDQAETNLKAYLGEFCLPKIVTIYNGVDIKKYMYATPCSDIVERFKGKKTAIMVAGFRYQKDQKTIIRAYSCLPDNFHFLFVGSGEKRKECEALVQELGLDERIHFLGLRTDIPQLLKSVDVVVMSSHFEGLSLSSIEGMASGKPFVASDVDGLREIVKGNGLLFEHENEKELAKIILSLDKNIDLYNKVVKSCQNKAIKYDISEMAKQYNKIYLSKGV